MRRDLGLLVLGSCFLFAACPDRDTARIAPIDFTVAQDEIEQLRSDYVNAFNAGDAARAAEFFAADAVLSLPNEQPARGREAIRQILERDAALYGDLHATAQETRVTADWTYDSGSATQSWRGERPAGAPERLESTYAALIEREADGAWRVRRLVISSDVPLDTGPAPGAPGSPARR